MHPDEKRHEKGRQDGFRRTRQAPQPAQAKENERRGSGATTPAAVWGNPAAAPEPAVRGEPEEELTRARSDQDEM